MNDWIIFGIAVGLVAIVVMAIAIRNWLCKRQSQKAYDLWQSQVREPEQPKNSQRILVRIRTDSPETAAQAALELLDTATNPARVYVVVVGQKQSEQFWEQYHVRFANKYSYWISDWRSQIATAVTEASAKYLMIWTPDPKQVLTAVGWDTDLIQQLEACGTSRTVLTMPCNRSEQQQQATRTLAEQLKLATSPGRKQRMPTDRRLLNTARMPNYELPDACAIAGFDAQTKLPIFASMPVERPIVQDRPVFAQLGWSPALSFSENSPVCRALCADPESLNSEQQQLFGTVLLWTHGLDFVMPWTRPALTNSIQPQQQAPNLQSAATVIAQVATASVTDAFGPVRTRESYFQWAGFDILTQHRTARAALGLQPLEKITDMELIARFGSLKSFRERYTASI